MRNLKQVRRKIQDSGLPSDRQQQFKTITSCSRTPTGILEVSLIPADTAPGTKATTNEYNTGKINSKRPSSDGMSAATAGL